MKVFKLSTAILFDKYLLSSISSLDIIILFILANSKIDSSTTGLSIALWYKSYNSNKLGLSML